MASIHNNTTNNHLHQRWIKPTNNNYINTKRSSHLTTLFKGHKPQYSIPCQLYNIHQVRSTLPLSIAIFIVLIFQQLTIQ